MLGPEPQNNGLAVRRLPPGGAFSGGGLASALWSFDWPASTTSLPQVAFLTNFLLLVAAIDGGSRIGELAGTRRALGF
jgi:hypothetical protein